MIAVLPSFLLSFLLVDCPVFICLSCCRKELEGRYKLDSPELREVLARECARNEASHNEELRRHQTK